jgi:hypothetical protein
MVLILLTCEKMVRRGCSTTWLNILTREVRQIRDEPIESGQCTDEDLMHRLFDTSSLE